MTVPKYRDHKKSVIPCIVEGDSTVHIIGGAFKRAERTNGGYGPIAWGVPIVMNTKDELQRTFKELYEKNIHKKLIKLGKGAHLLQRNVPQWNKTFKITAEN